MRQLLLHTRIRLLCLRRHRLLRAWIRGAKQNQTIPPLTRIASQSTTLTIEDCPCTIIKPVTTISSVVCHDNNWYACDNPIRLPI